MMRSRWFLVPGGRLLFVDLDLRDFAEEEEDER